jgi:hypothetical protein
MTEAIFIIAETAAATRIISLTVSSAIVKQVPSVIKKKRNTVRKYCIVFLFKNFY